MAALRESMPAAPLDDLSRILVLPMLVFKASTWIVWYAILYCSSGIAVVVLAHLILYICKSFGTGQKRNDLLEPLTAWLLGGHTLLLVLPWVMGMFHGMPFHLRLASSLLALCAVLSSMAAAFAGFVIIMTLFMYVGSWLGLESCKNFVDNYGDSRVDRSSQAVVATGNEAKELAVAGDGPLPEA